MVALGGCGVVWDDGHGFRHALGVGLVSWPIPTEPDPATVAGVDVYGVGVLATKGTAGVVIGAASERYVELGADRLITLDCLRCDLAQAHPRGGAIQSGTAR
jgi:hypothetical protein